MSPRLRVFMIFVSAVILAGIWLTGFDKSHWLLYLPPAFLIFAAVTGICPGLIILEKLGIPGSSPKKEAD